MKKSKTVALDKREINSLLGFFGGYGIMIAVGFLAVLSVCAAFIIYRTVKGQGEQSSEQIVKETEVKEIKRPLRKKKREESDRNDESTDGCTDHVDVEKMRVGSSETLIRAATSKTLHSTAKENDEEKIAQDLQACSLPQPCLFSDQERECEPTETECSQSQPLECQCEISDRFEDEIKDCLRENGSEFVEECVIEQCKDQDELYESEESCKKSQSDCQGSLASAPQDSLVEDVLSGTEDTSRYIQSKCFESERTQEESQSSSHHGFTTSAQEDLPGSSRPKLDVKNGLSEEESLTVAQHDQLASHPESELSAGYDTVEMDVVKETTTNNIKEFLTGPESTGFGRCFYAEHAVSMHSDLDSKEKLDPKQMTDHREVGGKDSNWDTGVLEMPVSKHEKHLVDHQQQSNHYEYLSDHNHQNYLGFSTNNTFNLMESSLSEVKCRDGVHKEKVTGAVTGLVDSLEESHEKTEISIMEATMDNNEWLNVGGPDTRAPPWLTQTLTGQPHGVSADLESSDAKKQDTSIFPSKEPKITAASLDDDHVHRRVAAVIPMPQMVRVSFRVHYITHYPSQFLAVTGNQQELGFWERFVPLQRAKNGFWASTIALPIESQVEWKFVVVEDGKILRWEECCNRHLAVTGQDEELHLDKSWGYL
ncbi:uncharacterized protein stbd1 [Chanos chanos]|uniref:Starch-binding domain-containing protein 1 n=1 Tax=Chanos chanos TaxID=29144 RepID=A0A6J2UX90_CHACN|nr:starch-binding domain-containing protein 1 [Chanos chanos]